MIIAATGHRPNKLGGYGDAVFDRLTKVAEDYLDKADPDKIITGMALGWDMAWATAGIRLGYPVIAAVPFEGQESMWPKASQEIYFRLLSQCEDVIFVNPPNYAAWKMQTRNEWMVDNATRIAALWDGSKGGTGNCIAYANKQNKPIDNLWEEFNNEI